MDITRIHFLIHPCCWAMSDAPDPDYLKTYGVLASEWYAARNLERKVNRRQKELIESLGPDEAMVVYPIGRSEPMRELIAAGRRQLDSRCIVLESLVCSAPAQLLDMQEPIRHFLDDEEMEGRQAFWDVVPESLRPEIEQEIRDACEAIGYDWSPHALKVVQGNRLYAREIAAAFEERELVIDRESVTAEAFGEGFEQCAMTWKLMIPGYLGWRQPIRNVYDLSVSGFRTLFDAHFRERIDLDGGISLFLWEKWHGLPLALFQRAAERLADARLYASLPVDGGAFEVWSDRQPIWPAADTPLCAEDGLLRVPVKSGSRKYDLDNCYILGAGYPYDGFREMLLGAEIAPAPTD